MSFVRYLAYLTALAAAAVLAISVLPGATAGAATVAGTLATLLAEGDDTWVPEAALDRARELDAERRSRRSRD